MIVDALGDFKKRTNPVNNTTKFSTVTSIILQRFKFQLEEQATVVVSRTILDSLVSP